MKAWLRHVSTSSFKIMPPRLMRCEFGTTSFISWESVIKVWKHVKRCGQRREQSEWDNDGMCPPPSLPPVHSPHHYCTCPRPSHSPPAHTFSNCTSLLLGSREVVSSTLGSAPHTPLSPHTFPHTFANCTSLLLGSREVVSSTLGSASPA